MHKKVFLGGTCNDSRWREELIEKLKIDYFNPVVENWDRRAQAIELHERNICDFCLYVITPKMTGVYSIAELIDDSNKRPDKTIFCYLETDYPDRFSDGQMRSLDMVANMVQKNGAKYLKNLDQVASYLNTFNSNTISESTDSECLLTDSEVLDSVLDTQEHANKVESYIDAVIMELNRIKKIHDKSKMTPPELLYFAKYGPMLKNLTYGSDEYKKCLEEMQKGIAHHYENNPHHPEYHKDGIRGMNLVNITEMLCDWYAASRRHDNGDINESLKINKKRFNISEDLIEILRNTIEFIDSKK